MKKYQITINFSKEEVKEFTTGLKDLGCKIVSKSLDKKSNDTTLQIEVSPKSFEPFILFIEDNWLGNFRDVNDSYLVSKD